MTRLLFAFLLLLLPLSVAYAQENTLGLYTDPAGTNCNTIAFPGVVDFYVVYDGIRGMKIISFSAPAPDCLSSAVHLADIYDAIYIVPPGNSQDGIILSHFNCEPTPVVVMVVTYFFPILPQNCCYYPVLPHPQVASGLIEALDCSDNVFYPEGLISTVNGDMSCPCPAPPTVPLDVTSWGQIKALYSD
jgi:hypothetical protein